LFPPCLKCCCFSCLILFWPCNLSCCLIPAMIFNSMIYILTNPRLVGIFWSSFLLKIWAIYIQVSLDLSPYISFGHIKFNVCTAKLILLSLLANLCSVHILQEHCPPFFLLVGDIPVNLPKGDTEASYSTSSCSFNLYI
jgi:hypothetical protein